MYRAVLESIVGFKLRGDRLAIEPCVPRGWREFEITYRRGSTTYKLLVENPHGLNHGVSKIEMDGEQLDTPDFRLVDDGKHHVVRVTLEPHPSVAS